MKNASTRIATRNEIAARAARDLEAISRQINRFASMTPKALMAYMRKHRSEVFCTISHPDGRGSLFCGAVAFNRFAQLSERIFDLDPYLEGRVEASHVREVLMKLYVACILREERTLDQTAAMLLLDKVIETLRGALINAVHFLPCVLFQNGGPDEFDIGPVKFTRTKVFFRAKRQLLRKSVRKEIEAHVSHIEAWAAKRGSHDGLMTEADSERLVRNLQARAIKTYRAYPWVAQVQVVGCEKEMTEELARKTVEAALHVIRIFLGADITEKVRLAWSRGGALKTATMWADDSDVVHVGIGSNSMGPVGFQNWYDGIIQGGGASLSMFGSAISVLPNPRPIFHLHQRLLDAIHWFGDAATETEATSRLIKYTSGIERLIFGRFKPGQRVDFAKRLKAVFSAFDLDLSEKTYNDALTVYGARSALLHGAWSPRHEDASQVATLAEELCRLCILCMGQVFPAMLRENGDVSSDELEKFFQELSKDANKVLAKLSGFLPAD